MLRPCLLLSVLVTACGSPREAEDVRADPPVLPEPESPEPVAAPQAPNPQPSAQPRLDVPPPARATVEPGIRAIASTVRPGLRAFADALESDGTLWMGQLSGNGGRDVVIFVPPGVRAEQPFELVVHFHGTYSENVAREEPGVPKKAWVGWNRLHQTIDALTELQARGGPNVALVYPISSGKRMEPSWRGWSNKMYDRMWMTPVPDDVRYIDAFDAMLDQSIAVLAELGVPASRIDPQVLAEGHSAGGIALRNVAVAGTKRVKEYLFLDASFQDWADGCFAAVREQGQGALVSLVITQGGIADPFGKRDPWCTRLEEAAATWPEHQSTCAGSPERKTGVQRWTCAEHREAAESWPDYSAWCEAMKSDMNDEPGVFVHRTRISHGKQPRHFSGGLELPAGRH